jgi:hypothetical protein
MMYAGQNSISDWHGTPFKKQNERERELGNDEGAERTKRFT